MSRATTTKSSCSARCSSTTVRRTTTSWSRRCKNAGAPTSSETARTASSARAAARTGAASRPAAAGRPAPQSRENRRTQPPAPQATAAEPPARTNQKRNSGQPHPNPGDHRSPGFRLGGFWLPCARGELYETRCVSRRFSSSAEHRRFRDAKPKNVLTKPTDEGMQIAGTALCDALLASIPHQSPMATASPKGSLKDAQTVGTVYPPPPHF